ncbi:MAG: heavy-metal-associated domain-containing protein, partial [Fibrobacter sp.]|nr:heavy-metal-associated domain-containing protein [Fibrobacter sp.]
HEEECDECVHVTYRVNGMSCSHCKACVEKAVRVLDGVEFAEADVSKKDLRLECQHVPDIDEGALRKAVEEAGFEFGGKV